MLKNNQQKFAIAFGYVLIAGFFFGLGKFSAFSSAPGIRIEEPAIDISQIYSKLKSDVAQSEKGVVAGETEISCEGKIKGNISASGKIYHLPGGAFYKRTNPEICFDSEAEAQASGFRKSKR